MNSYYGKITLKTLVPSNNNDTVVASENFYYQSYPTQVVPLANGWGINSFNLRPPDTSTLAMFGTYPAGFMLVKNISGNVYWPLYGIDDIGHVNITQGYQIYTSAGGSLSIMGAQVDYLHTPIALSSGWNMIAFLPPSYDEPENAFASISTLLVLAKNGSGRAYWPAQGIDDIGTMDAGQGYQLYMNSSTSFTYPYPLLLDKQVARKPLIHLPAVRHFASHAITGNNATLLAKKVSFGGKNVPDSSEVSAFDASGTLVGSGTVIQGKTAFAVWGKNSQTKLKDGCTQQEKVCFKLWDRSKEYPLDFIPQNGRQAFYGTDSIYLGELKVPDAIAPPRKASVQKVI